MPANPTGHCSKPSLRPKTRRACFLMSNSIKAAIRWVLGSLFVIVVGGILVAHYRDVVLGSDNEAPPTTTQGTPATETTLASTTSSDLVEPSDADTTTITTTTTLAEEPETRSVLLTLDPADPESCEGRDACHRYYVELEGLTRGSHTVECWSDGARFAVRTNSNWPDHVGCWSTTAGTEVWVVIDGIESNHVTTPSIPVDRSVLLTLDPADPESCEGRDACHRYYVELEGLTRGSHTVECWSDGVRFAVRTNSNWPDHVGCWSTTAGTEVWVVIDGIESNHVTTPSIPVDRSVLLTLDPADPESCEGRDACHRYYVELEGLTRGSHTVECWSDGVRFAVRTNSNWPDHVGCWSTTAGTEVWVVIDGIESNHVTTPSIVSEESNG